jgi:GYF domain 2
MNTTPMPPGGWYWGVGGQRNGPVTLPELQQLVRTGQLGPTALVWADGMPGWVQAGTLPVLFPQGTPDAGLGLLLPTGPQSGLSIAAGYLGLIGLLIPIAGPLGILFGILGLRDVKKHPEKAGFGRALTGIIAGGLVSLIWLLVIVAAILG